MSFLTFLMSFFYQPRQKSSSTKTPDRFKSQDEIFSSFSRLGARKSLGNSLSQDHWFEARHKLHNKQELEVVMMMTLIVVMVMMILIVVMKMEFLF